MAMLTNCEVCNSSCQSRNDCNYCNSCQNCNMSCNSPGGQCNTLQSFCALGGQSVGGFSFNQPLSSDQLFLSKYNWNRLIDYINSAYDRGAAENGGFSGLPSSDENEFMTADMFNSVSSALGGLGSSGPTRRAVRDSTIVYGSYFSSLEDYANSLQFTSSQCDRCNVSCDATCKDCQSCNTSNCSSCNGSCQSHNPRSCDYCCSCNTCQTCIAAQSGKE